ncbi:MAG: NAD(P)H-hydrate dehydratase [Planctomycetaceae bacterium]|nr:NAD(P)H-hydrate dehydratase [Planctomycetaceae bacterium]
MEQSSEKSLDFEPPTDLPRLPRRLSDSSKYDYGRVVIVAGSRGMAGAAALSSMAALRSGAGLVEVIVPESIQATVAGFDPCVMTYGLPEDSEGRFALSALAHIHKRCKRADVVALGPGLGRSDDLVAIVHDLWKTLSMPAVIDADALWALAQNSEWQKVKHAGVRVLTPHAGELQYLLGDNPSRRLSHPRKDLEHAAIRVAKEAGVVIVLKGSASLVTDGTTSTHNKTGNPGMATAGTGDVLTGIITALVGQQLSAFDAARLGVWIHGVAGDAASIECGEYSLTASQVIGCLPIPIKRCVAT